MNSFVAMARVGCDFVKGGFGLSSGGRCWDRGWECGFLVFSPRDGEALDDGTRWR